MPDYHLWLESAQGKEHLGPRCLLVALDETGHEEFADDNYPLFGLGGCAMLAGSYPDLVAVPWTIVKRDYFGGADTPLHASALHQPSQAQLSALGNFFGTFQFARLASMVTHSSIIDAPWSAYKAVAQVLARQLAAIGQHHSFDSVALIFESSERLNAVTEQMFKEFKMGFVEQGVAQLVPVHLFRADKSARIAALEVADFVMHAAGTAVRAHQSTGAPFLARKDFKAVFGTVPKYLVEFMLLNSLRPRGNDIDEQALPNVL